MKLGVYFKMQCNKDVNSGRGLTGRLLISVFNRSNSFDSTLFERTNSGA